jgi:ribosomal protein S18 acetylase RimI-like enzyme
MTLEGARPAGRGDLEELAALVAYAHEHVAPQRGGALFLDRDTPVRAEEAVLGACLDDPDAHVVVGTLDAAIVGYGIVRIELLPSGTRLGRIDELYVLPDGRAVGVGEAIMDAIVAFCEDRGCSGIDAVALPGDRDTKNFFETFGLVARAIVVHRALVPGTPAVAGTGEPEAQP